MSMTVGEFREFFAETEPEYDPDDEERVTWARSALLHIMDDYAHNFGADSEFTKEVAATWITLAALRGRDFFPMSPEDPGEAGLGVKVHGGGVLMQFDRAVTRYILPPDQATRLGKDLLGKAVVAEYGLQGPEGEIKPG